MSTRKLCTICARGGSKGVPNKNIRSIRGYPLIAITVIQAVKSGLFEHVAVSSDSNEILDAAHNAGADILVQRPDLLASDSAAKVPAIIHCAQEAERQTGRQFDIFVDLDATSPLRFISDIEAAVELLIDKNCSNVITGTPARHSPYFSLVEAKADGSVELAKNRVPPVVRRQDAPSCYDMNGSIYVWKREKLFSQETLFHNDTHIYTMPAERSIDVDTELDFRLVSFLAEQGDRFSKQW
ncbi:MAG: acylneuraminate cytidylyltransferase family protein [Bdellovibrionales bacterium]|nr:acylneuraminate cytidylyltransferase family protein [Bdellovibrionales bacterium]